MNIKFDYCKCIRIYEKAHLRSDFRKRIFPWLGLEATKVLLWWRVKIQNAHLCMYFNKQNVNARNICSKMIRPPKNHGTASHFSM